MENLQKPKVLVAILKNPEDFVIARDLHWYRIPIDKADKLLSKNWPPEWLAFYHPKNSVKKAFSVRYYAKVLRIEKAKRCQLFPQNSFSVNSGKKYYQIHISKLYELKKPIISLKRRRIIFIYTTFSKLLNATEINDLYHGSKIEETLWQRLKDYRITAERQELVNIGKKKYFLDFAIYCRNGKIDVEADGDLWHHNSEKAQYDNERNNALVSSGWHVLRFTSDQIFRENGITCLESISRTMESLGEENALKKFSRQSVQKSKKTKRNKWN